MPYKDPEVAKAYRKAYHIAHREERIAYDAAHREELNAYARAYRSTHKEEVRAFNQNYYATHKEDVLVCSKAYRSTHEEEIKAQKKAYRTAHLEEEKARKKTYREVHNEEIKAHKKTYWAAHREEIKAYRKAYAEEHTTYIICQQCGENKPVFIGSSGTRRFCSHECANKWHSGPNHTQWRGGVSFEPYCPKFNNELKEKVRSQFGRKCFLSGKEENGKKLNVHHCDYLKSQGCQGQRWSLLPLDHIWHLKTNHNRWYWFALLRDYWVYKYLTFHGMDIYEGQDRTAWLWEMYNQDAQT